MSSEAKGERSPIQPGDIVGHRYRVVEQIGEGTMGTVYRVEHTEMGTFMALKVIKDDLLEASGVHERFSREARAAAMLDDPRIVRVTDFGRKDCEGLFMVMELVEGQPLNEFVQPSMTRRSILSLFDDILGALEHAHHHGVVHRDLKPQNIIVVERNDRATVKILDFGLAKILEGAGAEDQLTQAFVVFGTPRYMSPEQAVGDPIDARADLYAIGVVLYELLGKRRPFTADTIADLLRKHVSATPAKLELDDEDGIRGYDLEQVILRAMAKDPQERFATATALREALQALAAAPPVAVPPSALGTAAQRVEHWWRQTRWAAARTARNMSAATRRMVAGGAVAAAVLIGLALQSKASTTPPSAAGESPSKRNPAPAEVAAIPDALRLPPAPEPRVEPTWSERVGAALAADQLDRASHLSALWTLETPDSPEAHILHGHIAFRQGQPGRGIAEFDRALTLDTSAVRRPEVRAAIETLIAKRDFHLLAFIKMLNGHADAPAADLLADLAKRAPRPRERREAYRGLERLGVDDRLDRFAYLTTNLRRNPTDHCELRRWYVQRLIALDDPRAANALRNELDRRTGFLNLSRTARCMEDRIERALRKWK